MLRTLRDPSTGEPIDRAVLLWFPAPASLTGEDVAEIQHHGGPAIAAALAEVLTRLPGLDPAGPGEFTRRAFLNGKLDLAAAEAVDDLVSATTRAQLRQAFHQAAGALARSCDRWRASLLDALALLEAELDLGAEEADVPAGLLDAARPTLERVRAEMAAALAGAGPAERLREGLVVAVVGPPNAGKSTLVNRLAGRDVAIVTPIPGTTRDVIEVPLELDGLPITLLDTAGLRSSEDPVERLGVERARDRAARADLCLVLLDATGGPQPLAELPGRPEDRLVAVNKIDAAAVPAALRSVPGLVPLSCRTGEGVDRLLDQLTELARERLRGAEHALVTRARHRVALGEAVAALQRLLGAPPGAELVLLAEELRLAAGAIGRVTGRVAVDELLDRIFARFCVGK